MMFSLLLAFLNVAFPKPDASLPYVERVYVIGATDPGVTNVTINGESFPVHPLGGWVGMVDVKEGENEIEVRRKKEEGRSKEEEVKSKVTIAKKPELTTNKAPAKVYTKLEYAADQPKARELTRVIVLDPGHGDKDTGAVSPHNLPEKDANLKLALAVRTELVARDFTVYLTREDDTFIELYERPRLAHDVDADLFVSIHHNAPPVDKDPRKLRYHAVYCWNELGEKPAKLINKRMAEALGNTLTNNGVPHANFAVTRNPEIPSCLIEADFITTPEAELDAWNPERRQKLAEAIAKGIEDYYE